MAQPLVNPQVRSRMTQSIVARTRQAQSDVEMATLAKARAKPQAEDAKPTAFIVGATKIVILDSGSMQLRAGMRLDAVEDASLLGTLKRQCDDLELLAVYDILPNHDCQDGGISEHLNYRRAA